MHYGKTFKDPFAWKYYWGTYQPTPKGPNWVLTLFLIFAS